MYKVFYDYYGNCYEYAVPEGSKLAQLLRFILVFLANQRFVFLIYFTVFYKF